MVLRRELTHSLEVAASADAAWAIYRSPNVRKILRDELLPAMFESMEIVQGNGSICSTIQVVLHPGVIPRSYKERLITNDDEKRLKVVIVFEGGYLDMGCTFYTNIMHILPTGPDSCIIKSSLVYEVKEEYAESLSSLITTIELSTMAEAVAKYLAKKKKVSPIRRELTHELEVSASADDVWAIYGSHNVTTILRDELLPGVFEKMEVVEGDVGAGSIIEVVLHPGVIPRSYKERLITNDDEKRLKVVIVFEGGYLDMGCTSYTDIMHILPTGPDSCIIKSSLVYEVKEEYAEAMSSLITTIELSSMAESVAIYLAKKKKVSPIRRELTHELEVSASADDVWAIYGSHNVTTILRDELLPGVFEKMEVVEGDGGAGSIIEVILHPGMSPCSYKVKLMKNNNDKRLKEVIILEGGYLEMGCTSYKSKIHILPKSSNTCLIESTVTYKVKDEYSDVMTSLITTEPAATMAKAVAKYILKKQIHILGYLIKPKQGLSVFLGSSTLLLCLILLELFLIGGVHF